MKYEDKSKYTGDEKDGKHHGHGVWVGSNGDRYEGEWEDGKRHGQGTFKSAYGTKYVGEFKDDLEHGKGTMYDIDGTVLEGSWYEGELKGDYSGDVNEITNICDCADALYIVIKDAYEKGGSSNLQYEVRKISEHCDQFGGTDQDYENCNPNKWKDALRMLESLY